jgi:cyclase
LRCSDGRALRRLFFLFLFALLVAGPVYAASKERRVTKLADGVYAIEHKHVPAGDSGNTTVIIGDREVFIVDSGHFPSVAREDIAQIRQWTSKPVAYVLNTHFHNDHNNGNRTYVAAFPAVAIVAQEETKKDMDLIQPGNIERGRTAYETAITAYKQGKDTDGRVLTEDEKKQVQELIPVLENSESEFKTIIYQSPTLTFKDKIDIDLGNREVQVKFLGRGNTAGDAIVYLPKEKIIVAGDLLVKPLPYPYDGFPSEWAQTLHKIAELDATTIVPGHGEILHDKAYLYLVADLMQSSVDQVRARIRQLGFPGGLTLDQIKGSVDLTPFRQKFAGDDKDLQAQFDGMASSLVKITFSEAAQR